MPSAGETRHSLRVAAWALCATAVVAATMSVNGLVPYADARLAAYDHNSYLAIAQQGPGAPGKASAPPFCWRLLTPMVAGSLPLPLPLAFYLISFLCVAGAAAGIHCLARIEGFSHRWSLVCLAGYLSLFWAAGFSLWNYLMVDAASQLVIVWGLCLVRARGWPPVRRAALLACILATGALNKESYLVLAAAALVADWRRREGGLAQRLSRASLMVGPALAVSVFLRWWITPDLTQISEFENYSLASAMSAVVRMRWESLPRWLVEALIDPWGPMILVPVLLGPAAAWSWFRARPEYLAMLGVALSQTLVATSVGRLIVAAAPGLVLFAVARVEQRAACQSRPAGFVATALAAQLLFQYLRRTTLGDSLPPYETTPALMIAYAVRAASLAAFGLLWMLLPASREQTARASRA